MRWLAVSRAASPLCVREVARRQALPVHPAVLAAGPLPRRPTHPPAISPSTLSAPACLPLAPPALQHLHV